MSRNLKISGALVALFVAVAAIVLVAAGGDDDPAPKASAPTTATTTAAAEPAAAPRVVTSDPRRLGRPGRGGVTFTEFLDFECESCAAAFPVIEDLRREYAGRVTFQLRYFPIESHRNARNAAKAVEAAHQQDELEAMYKRMYETQRFWGEQQVDQADLFRGFAKELDLDLKAYDAAVKDPRTAKRIDRDVKAGTELGVQGTPTFFINEERIEPQSLEELRQMIDAALAA